MLAYSWSWQRPDTGQAGWVLTPTREVGDWRQRLGDTLSQTLGPSPDAPSQSEARRTARAGRRWEACPGRGCGGPRGGSCAGTYRRFAFKPLLKARAPPLCAGSTDGKTNGNPGGNLSATRPQFRKPLCQEAGTRPYPGVGHEALGRCTCVGSSTQGHLRPESRGSAPPTSQPRCRRQLGSWAPFPRGLQHRYGVHPGYSTPSVRHFRTGNKNQWSS